MDEIFCDFNSIPWSETAVGVRSKSFVRSGKVLRLAEFTDEFVEEGWCMKGHMGYVLEGVLELNFEGTIKILKAGDGLAIPAGDKHKAKVIGKRATLFLVEET